MHRLNDFGVSTSQLRYSLSPTTSLRSGELPQHVLQAISKRQKDPENITHRSC